MMCFSKAIGSSIPGILRAISQNIVRATPLSTEGQRCTKKSFSSAMRSRPRVKREFWADVQADRSIVLSLERRRIAVYIHPSIADVFLKIMDGDETEYPEIALRRVVELPVEGRGYILFINDTLLMFKQKDMRRLRAFCKRKLMGP